MTLHIYKRRNPGGLQKKKRAKIFSQFRTD